MLMVNVVTSLYSTLRSLLTIEKPFYTKSVPPAIVCLKTAVVISSGVNPLARKCFFIWNVLIGQSVV